MSRLHILRDGSDLDAAIAHSHDHPVFVFKHSLICPASSVAWRRYQDFLSTVDAEAEFTAIEIQKTRDLSNTAAERTSVRHESPQALLLKDGQVRWHASHGAITEQSLADALAEWEG